NPALKLPSALCEGSGVKLEARSRRALALGFVALAIAFGIPRVLTHSPYQRLGVRLDWGRPDRIAHVTDVVGPPGKGLLQKGDLLLEVEGRPLTQQTLIDRMKGKIPPISRGPVSLVVERQGRRFGLEIPPLSLTHWQRIRVVALPLVTAIAAPLVAFFRVWRRPDLGTAWAFLWFTVLQAVGEMWSLFRYPQVQVSGGFDEYRSFYHAFS